MPRGEVDVLVLVDVPAVTLRSDMIMPGRNIAIEYAAVGDRAGLAAVHVDEARSRLSEDSQSR